MKIMSNEIMDIKWHIYKEIQLMVYINQDKKHFQKLDHINERFLKCPLVKQAIFLQTQNNYEWMWKLTYEILTAITE